jgi:hypothetical protein
MAHVANDRDLYPFCSGPDGKITEVSYMYKRPGSTEQEPKVTLVTKVDDQVCGVGYYKK